MNRSSLWVMALVSVVPVALAQQQPQRDTTQQSMRNIQELHQREARNMQSDLERGDHQAWLNSMKNLTRLRARLAEAWQSMGMSPQGAQVVANAYDPDRSNGYRQPLHGKSDQEVADMMRAALAAKDYQKADQLLIDYQREKLRLSESAPQGDRP
ncbi:hypothetical protein [Fulvimonas yonginensis]|uniref:Uncharacterized protein n=1 Tax=Fulvimonas yonginensis TaxID=1495200 RepID=A0ABU8JE41_9GAMM